MGWGSGKSSGGRSGGRYGGRYKKRGGRRGGGRSGSSFARDINADINGDLDETPKTDTPEEEEQTGRRGRRRRKPPEEATLIDVEAKALDLLGRRDHAVEELRRKLRERRYPQPLIDQTIERMLELRYLDDDRFVERMTASLMRQGWGPYRIRQKLNERGLDRDLIDDTLAEYEDDDVWLEHALRRVTIKYRCEPAELDREDRDRAYRHLQYRGYSGGVIRRVLFQ